MDEKQHKAWISPSTLRWFREARKTPKTSFFDLIHGYVYARWPYLYIGIGTGEHPVAQKYKSLLSAMHRLSSRTNHNQPPAQDEKSRNDKPTYAEGYHGKVMPLASITRLVMVNEEIRIPDLEQVIPYQRARALILQNPDHIVALQCPCRTARRAPCLPLDVCLIVGEPFAGFVIEHHPQRARWITQEQAVEILRQEDARGHVHHAFFKDAMFGRFYAICNCCSCCCGALQSHQRGTPMLAASGYVCQVDTSLCIGCGDCAAYCQFGALSLVGSTSTVNLEACMGCGVCVDKCEQGALALQRELSKGQPLEIDLILNLASARVAEFQYLEPTT
jgi:ferredoxin